MIKNTKEVAILFNINLSIVLKIVLNYKLAKILDSLKRLVVIRLNNKTQLINKSIKNKLERKSAY